MTNDSNKNSDVAWQAFEKSGSISDFLEYHQAKPEKELVASRPDAHVDRKSKKK